MLFINLFTVHCSNRYYNRYPMLYTSLLPQKTHKSTFFCSQNQRVRILSREWSNIIPFEPLKLIISCGSRNLTSKGSSIYQLTPNLAIFYPPADSQVTFWTDPPPFSRLKIVSKNAFPTNFFLRETHFATFFNEMFFFV